MIRRLNKTACVASTLLCLAFAVLWLRARGHDVELHLGFKDGRAYALAVEAKPLPALTVLVTEPWPHPSLHQLVTSEEPRSGFFLALIGWAHHPPPDFQWGGIEWTCGNDAFPAICKQQDADGIEIVATAGPISAALLVAPLWLMVVLTSLFPLLSAVLAIRARKLRQHRLRLGLCPLCGFDLRASSKCPECGGVETG